MATPLIEQLRVPMLNEERMAQWDGIRAAIARGDRGSWPRDVIESWLDAADQERSEAASELASLRTELAEVKAENERLRAALAQSDQPCAYCSLPADEWAKCKSGFPGCDRADDAMGCPHLGSAMELELVKAERDRLAEHHRRLISDAQGGNALKGNVELMRWLADRLVNVYGESPNVDFVQALRERAWMLEGALAAARALLPEGRE